MLLSTGVVFVFWTSNTTWKTRLEKQTPPSLPLPSTTQALTCTCKSRFLQQSSPHQGVVPAPQWALDRGPHSGARRVDPCNLAYLAERDACSRFPLAAFRPGPGSPPGLAPVQRAGRRVLINCRIGGAFCCLLLRLHCIFLAAPLPLHDRCFAWLLGWVCLPCRLDALGLSFSLHHCVRPSHLLDEGFPFCVGGWTGRVFVSFLTLLGLLLLTPSITPFHCSVVTRGYLSCCAVAVTCCCTDIRHAVYTTPHSPPNQPR